MPNTPQLPNRSFRPLNNLCILPGPVPFLGNAKWWKNLIRFDHTVERLEPAKAVRRKIKSGAGSRITAGIIDTLEHNPALDGDKWYGSPFKIGVAQKMVKDAYVRASIAYRSNPIKAGTPEFIPGGDRDIDIEAARFCQKHFVQAHDWDSVLSDALRFHVDGFSLIEMTDDVRPIDRGEFPLHPGGGFGIVPTGFWHIPAHSVVKFHQNPDNPRRLRAITQRILHNDVEGGAEREIPIDSIIRWTFGQIGADFSGVATLRSAYAGWKIKLALLVIMAMKHEKYGLGLPVLSLPEEPTDEDLDAAELILSEMRAHQKGFIQLPHGYTFRYEVPAKSDGTDIELAIDLMNRDIIFNVQAPQLSLGDSKFGSFALAKSHEGQFGIAIDSDGRFIDAGFNHGADGFSVIKRITQLNYPGAAIPIYRTRNLPTRDWEKILPVAIEAIKEGAMSTDDKIDEAFRERLQLPAPDMATRRFINVGVEERETNAQE